MKVKDAAMQAFPFIEPAGDEAIKAYHPGLSLRDYFAAKAMLIYLQDPNVKSIAKHPDAIAFWCYIMADSMLKARVAK